MRSEFDFNRHAEQDECMLLSLARQSVVHVVPTTPFYSPPGALGGPYNGRDNKGWSVVLPHSFHEAASTDYTDGHRWESGVQLLSRQPQRGEIL
jgi:hypothetical protein